MFRRLFYPFFTAIVAVVSVPAMADGLTLGGTRLIYDAAKKEASISLSNQGSSPPQLVQSWVSDKNKGVKDIPFITTPPVFKLFQNTTSAIRTVYVGGNRLPDDRESLWLLNVRAVPAVEKKDNPARLTIATQNIIKLIYRPSGLTSAGAEKAGEDLKLSVVNGGVRFENPTPYIISLAAVTINGKSVDRPGTIEPKSSLLLLFKDGKPARITWRTINDFGGLTKESTVHF